MTDILASVIIPVYNKEDYLSETLDSVLNQDFKAMEIILINDGSKDNSKHICEEYARKDNRIVFVDQKNSGASASRNHGIDIARGKYIFIVDADDEIAPGMISKMVSIAQTEDLDLVCCNFVIVSSDGAEEKFNYSYTKNSKLGRQYIEEEIVPNTIGIKGEGSSMGYHCSMIYKKSMLDDDSIRYDIQQTKEEDKPFIVKCLSVANSIYFVEDSFYRYIKREDSLITKYSKRYDNCVKNLNLYESLFRSKYDFSCGHKINYNLDVFEECIQFVYLHKKDVKSVKEEILEMIKKPETKLWFQQYQGQDPIRLKVKKLFINNDYDKIYNVYKNHNFIFRTKIFIRDLMR